MSRRGSAGDGDGDVGRAYPGFPHELSIDPDFAGGERADRTLADRLVALTDDELGVRAYGIMSGSGCEERDDGPFGITTRYERALITQLRGGDGLTSSFNVSVFCRRYGRPVAGCG